MFAARILLAAIAVSSSALAAPAPPGNDAQFKPSGSKTITASRRSDSMKLARQIGNSEPNILSATLLAHKHLGPEYNINAAEPFTLPNIKSSLSKSGSDDDLVLLELIRGAMANNKNLANNFFVEPDDDNLGLGLNSNTNVGRPLSSVSQTGSLPTSSSPGVNNDITINSEIIGAENLGNQPQNAQNFGSPLPSLSNQDVNNDLSNLFSHRTQNLANQLDTNQNFGVPLPAFVNDNQGSSQLSTGGLTETTDFGVPLPTLANEAASSGGSSQTNAGSLTVADMLLGLNGQDGIKAISLGDLKDPATSQSQLEGNLLQQLRNAVISSGNLGLGELGLGDLENELTQLIESTQDLGKDLPADGGLDVGISLDEKQLDNVALDSTVDANATTEVNPFELEENIDFEFDYDDDFEALPPQPPNVFRSKLTDIFFTKGQWIGTIIGGLMDISSSVSGLFGKGSEES